MDMARSVEPEGLTAPSGSSLLAQDGMGASRQTIARVGALVYTMGTIVIAAALLLPHPAELDERGFAVLLTLNSVIAIVLWIGGTRLPTATFPVLAVLGSAIISASLYLNGSHDGGEEVHFELIYLVTALYAAYFFSRFVLAAVIAFTAVFYAAELALSHPELVSVTHWTITVGTVALAGALVRTMREWLDGMIERLHETARTDFLTGLLNRRGFIERFEHELEVARRSGRPLSLLVGDLDRFKKLNDDLGHPAGDQALVKVAKILDSTRRRVDIAGRIGGEEFALLTPFTDAKGGFNVAERVRQQVAQALRIRAGAGGVKRGPTPSVTISMGVVSFPAHGQTVEALMHAADRALYVAKEQGRDRTIVYKVNTVPRYSGTSVNIERVDPQVRDTHRRDRDDDPAPRAH